MPKCVVEKGSELIGCGGWSRRQSLSGSDSGRTGKDALLDPSIHPARIRAFFIHPNFTRRGIARSIMNVCEQKILEAGFRDVEISATLAGELLYKSFGYTVIKYYPLPMPGGTDIRVVLMRKRLDPTD